MKKNERSKSIFKRFKTKNERCLNIPKKPRKNEVRIVQNSENYGQPIIVITTVTLPDFSGERNNFFV